MSDAGLFQLWGWAAWEKPTSRRRVIDLVRASFETVFWFSLLNAPPFEHFLRDCLNFLDRELYAVCPLEAEAQACQLVEQLSCHRCLLIWDNAETLLMGGNGQTACREGYEAYGQLHAVWESAGTRVACFSPVVNNGRR